MAYLRAKVNSLALTAAAILIALQVIMPMVIDTILGVLAVGIVYLSNRITRTKA